MAGKMAGEYLHEWVEGSGKSGVSQALKKGGGDIRIRNNFEDWGRL